MILYNELSLSFCIFIKHITFIFNTCEFFIFETIYLNRIADEDIGT